MMLRGFGFKTEYRWVFLIVGAAMMSRMVRGDAYDGQVNFMLLLLLLIGLREFIAGRTLGASMAWALMMVLKPFTGSLVFYLLRRGYWKFAAILIAIAGTLFIAWFVATSAALDRNLFWLVASDPLVLVTAVRGQTWQSKFFTDCS